MNPKDQRNKKRKSSEARSRRIQQIMFAILALVVVASMIASLVVNP